MGGACSSDGEERGAYMVLVGEPAERGVIWKKKSI